MTDNSTAGLPPLIPREVLFGNPERASPLLSPDGRRIAYLAPVDGVLNVWVGTPGGTDFRPVTHDTERGVRVYLWAHDGEHVLYLQDKGGDENWRLYRVPVDGSRVDDLTPFDDVQVQVVAHDKHHPHEMLLGINRDDQRLHDVYHLNLRTGTLTLAVKNPGQVAAWVADPQLAHPDLGFAVRAAVASTDDGGSELLVRDGSNDPWRTLLRWTPEDALTSGPLAFTRDSRGLYLMESRDANTSRLVLLDTASGRTRVLAEDPSYDLGGVVLHPDTREVQMVAFTRAHQEWTVVDPAIEPAIEAIRSLNPGDFEILDRTDDDRRWIVGFTQDNAPSSYYAFDTASREAEFLFHTRPALAQYVLATMEPVRFEARDGLAIEGYLTLPPAAPTPLPLVLNVHGGPWHRDVWGYDPEAQWLANRGYACLQVNFRGSTGYGKKFLNAGDREWGGRMHDDLVDAVRWAVDRGVAHPSRVAIYGGSYGGYAALVGATFTPDLFRCAISIVGPSNLITFINTIPPYWSTFLSMLHQRLGNPETESEFLWSRSPLSRVDQIRIPMLIAQGANDPRVKQAESEQIVAAMREKEIPHDYLLFPDEGHGFAKPENRLTFYAAAEGFLARHLGGRAEP